MLRSVVLILLCILCILPGGCQTGFSKESAEEEDPTIHWDGLYRIFEISPGDDVQLKSLPGLRDLAPVAATERGLIYRIPVSLSRPVEKLGHRPLRGVPFRYVDPGIEERRKSNDPSVWFAGYKDLETVEKILKWFERERPGLCHRYEIGRSVKGKPIIAMRISLRPERDENEPSLLYNGAHHGNELLSIDYVLDMGAALLNLPGSPGRLPGEKGPIFDEQERKEILSQMAIWIVPVVNPDGVEEYWNHSIFAGRKNANGVDLNRNYPFFWNSGTVGASSPAAERHDYRGPRAGSEPETKAMMDLASKERFTLSFSYHTFATRILFPYTIDGAMNPWPDRAYFYAKELAALGVSFRPTKPYEAARKLYPVDGTDQDWLFHSFGTMAFIVEGSMDTPDYQTGVKSIAGMRPVWAKSIHRVLRGPRIEVQVLGPGGRPVPDARIRSLDEVLLEGEEWTVHPRTGRFDLLPGPKEDWTLQIWLPGHRAVQKKISCGGVCKEKFYLTP